MTRVPSDTFKRLAVAYPDRVGNANYHVDIDNYRIAVVSTGTAYKWTLDDRDRHLTSGDEIGPALAWLAACDALDTHHNQTSPDVGLVRPPTASAAAREDEPSNTATPPGEAPGAGAAGGGRRQPTTLHHVDAAAPTTPPTGPSSS